MLIPAFVQAQKVISITVNDGINPATAEFIHKGINLAETENAECLIIHLNTPGGLLTSTRTIVSNIMEADVPVIVYVSPSGAHAGSAGVFITMAANIAAMAPGTNIGAAHPVSLMGKPDSILNEKGASDAAAFIRTIAEKRNRNVQWAEEAVRKSVSITEREALDKNVINFIATDVKDLLSQSHGKEVNIGRRTKTLNTANATVQSLEMGGFLKVMSKMSDPNIAYIMLMLGFFGLIFELFSPGVIFPGIAGVIFLILSFYSMSTLPVNWAALSLIIFGIILFLLEIKVISHGMLAIGGIVSVLLGSMFLFRNSPGENIMALSWSVILSVTAVSTLFFIFIITFGLRAQRTKVVSGTGVMIGLAANAMEDLDPSGHVRISGETWRAISLSGKIQKDETVVVQRIEGLTLYVEAQDNYQATS